MERDYTSAPMSESPASDGWLSLSALVESMLFVASGSVSISQLAQALEVRPTEVELALQELEDRYTGRGLKLQRSREGIQITTAPTAAAQVERFLGLESTTHLSRAALECLAIIAYKQPVTRPELDALRGVNSDSAIKNLLSKGLIEEHGRAEGPGRPILYVSTPAFLQHFGLGSLEELPRLEPEMTPAPSGEQATPEA